MDPLLRQAIQQGINLRPVTKGAEQSKLKKSEMDPVTADGVKRSNDVTLNTLNNQKKTSGHTTINSKAHHMNDEVSKSILSKKNTPLVNTASSTCGIKDEAFKSNAISKSPPTQLISSAQSMRRCTESASDKTLSNIEATLSQATSVHSLVEIAIQSDEIQIRLITDTDKIIEILTNKLELMCGKNWDGELSHIDHPQKDMAISLSYKLEKLIIESDSLKTGTFSVDQIISNYNELKSSLEEISAYDQVIMKDGKQSILEHGIEVSPGIFTGGSKVYLEKLTTSVNEMQLTFPILKNAVPASAKKSESNPSVKNYGQTSEGVTERLSNRQSTKDKMKNGQVKTDSTGNSFRAQAEGIKAKKIIEKEVKKEEEKKMMSDGRVEKQNIMDYRLKRDQ